MNLGVILTIINIGASLLTASGLYWKMRISISKLELDIENMKEERKKSWERHDADQCRFDDKIDKIVDNTADAKERIIRLESKLDFLSPER